VEFSRSEKEVLCLWRDYLGRETPWETEAIKEVTWAVAKDTGLSRRELATLIRLAVSGEQHGPSLFDMLVFIGRPNLKHRIDRALGLPRWEPGYA
jgi:glutamyl/glutaminyl-tRNA synthetase